MELLATSVQSRLTFGCVFQQGEKFETNPPGVKENLSKLKQKHQQWQIKYV